MITCDKPRRIPSNSDWYPMSCGWGGNSAYQTCFWEQKKGFFMVRGTTHVSDHMLISYTSFSSHSPFSPSWFSPNQRYHHWLRQVRLWWMSEYTIPTPSARLNLDWPEGTVQDAIYHTLILRVPWRWDVHFSFQEKPLRWLSHSSFLSVLILVSTLPCHLLRPCKMVCTFQYSITDCKCPSILRVCSKVSWRQSFVRFSCSWPHFHSTWLL